MFSYPSFEVFLLVNNTGKYIYKYNNRSVTPSLARVDDTHPSQTTTRMPYSLNKDVENMDVFFPSVCLHGIAKKKERLLRIIIVSIGSSYMTIVLVHNNAKERSIFSLVLTTTTHPRCFSTFLYMVHINSKVGRKNRCKRDIHLSDNNKKKTTTTTKERKYRCLRKKYS